MNIKTNLKSGWKYTVQYGDSLSKIAQTFYGNGNLWPQIYNYKDNKAIIGPNPNLVRTGIKIELW